MICRGKGQNKEHCDKVIKEILENWDKVMYGKTTNREGDRENEVD